MQDILSALRLLIELVTVVGVVLAAWQSRAAVVQTRRIEKDIQATPSKVVDEFKNGGQSIFPCYKPTNDR